MNSVNLSLTSFSNVRFHPNLAAWWPKEIELIFERHYDHYKAQQAQRDSLENEDAEEDKGSTSCFVT